MHPSVDRYLVICDLADGPVLIEIELPAGAQLQHAVQLLKGRFGAAIDWDQAQSGIWGQRRPLHTVLAAGDRIEVYRPLLQDPRAARRANAKRSRRLRSGAGARRTE